ncbi:hypothetical protein G4X40_13960 [Rhodococcus sp. D2-41]|uniref:Uncharacterized protein n=1 Tax=Speluncibacter jeojiensis TaxID=2710754 RepID=A0A9X4RI91_9ACTN|nr:hypothetical protein [Rhodococcus sp. D2-41]MDG3011257.1 hypothetical protein [Rhodococcus sp. D2-41]MDG3015891.1 hypothetical protein [Corynebacteriales bacterium D3-21]
MSSAGSGRVLRVFVEGWIIEDGSLARPEVGRTMQACLSFHRNDRPDRVDSATLRAVATPQSSPDPSTYDGRLWWSSILRGDGWTAYWRDTRPWTGRVEVAGALSVDDSWSAGPVRGLVTRVRLATCSCEATSPREPYGWQRVPGLPDRYVDVQVAPGRFERVWDESSLTGRIPELGHTYDHQTGVLVDLDLDRAEPEPPRPRFAPGAVGACGTDLWVLDRQLPILVHLADPAGEVVAIEHLLPASVDPDPARGARRVFVDADGCWASAADGILRVTPQPTGESRAERADIGQVRLTAARDGVLLTLGERTHLFRPDAAPSPIELPSGRPQHAVATDDGFLILVVEGEEHQAMADGRRTVHGTRYRPVAVTSTGEVTVGPQVAVMVSSGVILTPTPDGVRLDPMRGSSGPGPCLVTSDLAVLSARPPLLPRAPLAGGRVGDRTWLTTDRPDGTGRSGWWPLSSADELPPTSCGGWLFVLLDAATSQVTVVIPIDDPQPDVAATADGTVWIAGAGLRGLRRDGSVVEIDVPALLG